MRKIKIKNVAKAVLLSTVLVVIAMGVIKALLIAFTVREIVGGVILLSMFCGTALYLNNADVRVISEIEKLKAEHKSAADELCAQMQKREDAKRRLRMENDYYIRRNITKIMDRFHEEFRKEETI